MKIKTDAEMRDILRRACVDAGGQAAWCNGHYHRNRKQVGATLSGEREVTRRIARELGYERVWRKIKD